MVNMSQALVLDLPRGRYCGRCCRGQSESFLCADAPVSYRSLPSSICSIFEVVAMCISQVYRHPHHRQRQHYMARVELRGL